MTMTEAAQLGKRLTRARERARLSQTELAATLGVARGTVSRWESGERTPSLAALREVAAALNVTVSTLIGEVA